VAYFEHAGRTYSARAARLARSGPSSLAGPGCESAVSAGNPAPALDVSSGHVEERQVGAKQRADVLCMASGGDLEIGTLRTASHLWQLNRAGDVHPLAHLLAPSLPDEASNTRDQLRSAHDQTLVCSYDHGSTRLEPRFVSCIALLGGSTPSLLSR
jgi:hypothetical protein